MPGYDTTKPTIKTTLATELAEIFTRHDPSYEISESVFTPRY